MLGAQVRSQPPAQKVLPALETSGIMAGVKVCPVCHREFGAGVTQCADDGVPLVDLSTEFRGRAEELVGQIIEGRYKVERIIGKGGMGTVYACRHVVVGKIAAMKVLRTGGERTEGVLQRFVREAQTANLLRSRHIVECSDFGQLPSGAFFVVMELLEGHDLARAMRQGMTRAQLVHVFVQVAETLQLAHDKGIVHRDLKPDNVFLVTEGGDSLFVKLLDFGIAKIVHGESNGGLTETGVILGTPYYMSPEQARAELVDHRSDIYSLGVMMYRAFAGRLPFVADSTMGVLTRHITEEPEPPSRLAAMDQATERMILRCMAKRPEHRFQSMREVVESLKLLPTAPVPAVQEQTTVFDGAIYSAAANAPSGAHAAYPQATGAHPQAPAPYAQPSGAYPQAYAQPSGAYPQAYAQPSGAYPQAYAQPSGAYTPAPDPRAASMGPPNPYAQASGAYPAQAAYPAQPPAATSGQHPAYAATAPQGAFDPRLSAQPAIGYATPQPQPNPVLATRPSAVANVPSGETTRGLAATGALQLAPPPRSNTATIILAAVAMTSLGALGALLLHRSGAPPAVPAQPAATISASATASAPQPASAAPASAAPAASSAPSAEPAAAPSGAPSVAAPRPRTGGPAPKATPSAAPSATPTKRTPRDIRSPFD
jgi:serine/threonine-protein kinase